MFDPVFCVSSELEATNFRRSIQPVESHQLHGLLRWPHQRSHGGPHAEDLPTLRHYPGDQGLQGQGLRIC